MKNNAKVLYNIQCPRCANEGRDLHQNNLSVCDDGKEVCWAGHGIINKTNNHISLLELEKRETTTSIVDDKPVKETVTGVDGIKDAEVIRFLWQYHLYEDSWKKFGLKQIVSGTYERDSDSTYIYITKGIYIPYGKDSFLIRQLEHTKFAKVIRSTFATFWSDGMFDTQLPLIIVEDVFSAMKASLSGFAACSLNGTSINDYLRPWLMRFAADRELFIWLDNDVAGQRGTEKLQRFLSQIGPAKVIKTDKDPKWYEPNKFKEIVRK